MQIANFLTIKSRSATKLIIFLFLLIVLISACTPQASIPVIEVVINQSGEITTTQAEVGTTVQSILAEQNITLSTYDQITPPLFTVLTGPATITITRVEEKFDTEEIVIPYEQQTVRNESLPEKQNVLVQTGINGRREITYRSIFENGKLVSRTIVKQVDSILPRSEIIMVGVQSPFQPVEISGKLVYITAGNAWMMESDTANRIPLITSGDLDGRIFSLSNDGKWLLFTRSSTDPEIINELWVLNLSTEGAKPVYLKTNNVIHFAEWMPGYALAVLASTVEKRQVAPGWQANNNLIRLTLGANGRMLKEEELIESNSGGIYGWWGTDFLYSPDGKNLAFSRPDSVGLVDFERKELVVLQNILPFQTQSEWAWVSPIAWSPDSNFLYWIDHISDSSFSNSESSPFFDLKTTMIKTQMTLNSVKNVGMFAYPSLSPLKEDHRYDIIFLQAIFPENSETSNYRAMVMDRDGSNVRVLFPTKDTNGLKPQNISWSPCELQISCRVGIIYKGNIWLVDVSDTLSEQITGDGLVSKMDWK